MRGPAALHRLTGDRARWWLLVPACVLSTSAITWLAPQRGGPLAAFEALAPIVYLATLLLVPVAVRRRSLLLVAALGMMLAVGFLAYRTPASGAKAPMGPTVSILAWNLHGEPLGQAGFAEVTRRTRPDVIVLEEAAISAESEPLLAEWPIRRTFPDAATPPGMVILSRLPFTDEGRVDAPAAAWDRLRAPWVEVSQGGSRLTIVAVHLAFPLASFPCPYCPDTRDAQAQALAAFAAARAPARVVLAGDFNLTEREPAYRDLATAMTDVVADGGATWRPMAVAWLPPVLRLDYVFASPGVPAAARIDCAGTESDHCPVVATIGLR